MSIGWGWNPDSAQLEQAAAGLGTGAIPASSRRRARMYSAPAMERQQCDWTHETET